MTIEELLLLLFNSLMLCPVAFFWGGCGCCGGCACEECTEGEYDCTYQIELAGITNGTCSSCGDLNATYIVGHDPATGANCRHTLFASLPCMGGSPNLELLFPTRSYGDWSCRVTLSGATTVPWRKSLSVAPYTPKVINCKSASTYPMVCTRFAGGPSGICGWASSTATVTRV